MGQRLTGLLGKLKKQPFVEGFVDKLGEGTEDYRRATHMASDIRGNDFSNMPMFSGMASGWPIGFRGRQAIAERIGRISPALGERLKGHPEFKDARDSLGVGTVGTIRSVRGAGEVAGTVANDFVGDRTRAFWWLLNAPQAVVNVAGDAINRQANPGLFKTSVQKNRDGKIYTYAQNQPGEKAWGISQGMLDGAIGSPHRGQAKKGYQVKTPSSVSSRPFLKDDSYEFPVRKQLAEQYLTDGKPLKDAQELATYLENASPENLREFENRLANTRYITKRNAEPGHLDSLLLGPQIAINSSLGLLNPFGGQEGYSAVFPTEDDASVSENPIAEIGAKYILGRTGNLLPWDEFKKVRPDVSKGEYMRYKAYKYDKEADFNPFDDGQFTIPTGVLKGTMEGIHGPEIQFLGRTIPAFTGVLPTASAMAGSYFGLGAGRTGRGSLLGGLVGGLGGLAAGSISGSIIENERRRRNQLENESSDVL